MVGHNSRIEQLVGMLTDEERTMPTCLLVHIQFPIKSWNVLH